MGEPKQRSWDIYFLSLQLSILRGRGFLAKTPQLGSGGPRGAANCFLSTAGPLPIPSLGDAAASFLPPDAEVPQCPVSLPQSPIGCTQMFLGKEKEVR